LNDIYHLVFGFSKDDAGLLAAVSLVFVAIFLTAIGVFDEIAKVAGAGTLVPITGFANAVVSPAIDSKSEGWVLGVGAKIFTVAGPVLLYGILAGAIYGVIYYFMSMI
jgi:stage V sporulation protein AC